MKVYAAYVHSGEYADRFEDTPEIFSNERAAIRYIELLEGVEKVGHNAWVVRVNSSLRSDDQKWCVLEYDLWEDGERTMVFDNT